jgi:RNA polymerase sigma-70 factor (ECF subfamily)
VELDEATLIERCRAGEASAFASLVAKHQDSIFNAIYRMLGHYEDATDVAQDTFLKAFQGIRDFRGDSAFHTWLFRIALNAVTSYRRRQAVRHSAEHFPLSSGGEGDDLRKADPPDPSPGPADELQMTEEQKLVHDAIAALDPEYRDAVVLRHIQGYSYDDIAVLLACPRGTVKSRIHRGRMELKAKLAPLFAGSGSVERRP